ncbi:MAG: hypothetical protein PHO41_07985 [Eubacteriales bacterium]|nr:hypothetical protein [Eubacteriales bacterium]
MTTVRLEALARGLFGGERYIECLTGRIAAGFIVPEDKKADTALYAPLPRFSIAHVEQIYLREKYGDTDEYKAYGLDAYPTFPIEVTDELCDQMSSYSGQAHIFIMDRLDRQAEIAYDAFTEKFRMDFAKKWCEDNGIAYEYMFKKNE